MLTALLLAVALQKPSGPVEFGKAELRMALESARLNGIQIRTGINPDGHRYVPAGQARPERPRETYKTKFSESQIEVVSWDDNGLMYGLLEAAERVRNAARLKNGKYALPQGTFEGKPYLAERGWNMFLPLPWDYEKNFVDNDPAALTDPNRWFFMNEDYWRTLFDQMAKSRLNWLDIHGPYDLDTTRFPNLYAYFIQSDKFPKVGVSPEIKATLLRQLNHIIDLAHARGIRVSLMSYEARFDVPHNTNPGYRGTEAEVYDYTKEVVEKMIRECPKLDKIGYRIGESGRGPEFFKCYTEAVKNSGRDIPVYTRSWVTTKARVVPLARESSDFTVEIKYNGEQWGAPYIMQGGRTAGWYSYFWEDYLSYSGSEKAKKMWEGNEGDSPGSARSSSRFVSDAERRDSESERLGGNLKREELRALQRWPSQPYKIVWQVRANGTHRIFPFYQPHWTRSSILSMKVGTTSGYTIESMGSYFPQEPRYYMNPDFGVRPLVAALPGGDLSPLPRKEVGAPSSRRSESGDKSPQSKTGYRWIHQRDEMYMACWGRLGYDPTVDDMTLLRQAVRGIASKGPDLVNGWSMSSMVVPMAFMAMSLGPDHRNHAPELEWGGDNEAYLQSEPFDSHVVKGVREELAIRTTGGRDGRFSVSEIGARVGSSGIGGARAIRMVIAPLTSRSSEVKGAVHMLWHLGEYYENRFFAVSALAESEANPSDRRWLGVLNESTDKAKKAWSELSSAEWSGQYRPFTDRLRMHRHDFHWSKEGESVQRLSLGDEVMRGNVGDYFRQAKMPPDNCKLELSLASGMVQVNLKGDGLSRAWLLKKPLPSSTFFHKSPMKKIGSRFVAEFKRESWGHCVAAEVEMSNGTIRRIPWWEKEQPYITVPSLEKPTPFIYSAEEAMRYLKPEILDPAKYGWMIVGTRGWMFHTRFDNATKRKVLSAVERGMNMLVMQQDYTSGRYPLDWLPTKPKVVNRPETTFDPAGALGMERVETKEILWQPFEAGNGWEVIGNGGVARTKYGKGEIWMVQARFLQRMHIPGVARNLKRLLEATVGGASPSFEGGVGVDGKSMLAFLMSAGTGTCHSSPESMNPNPNSRIGSSPTPTPPSREGPLKPAILIDTGTEGANYVTSVIPDFMNAHDLPFLTLGEVIAKEQGMDSLTPVPGPDFGDDVLQGKGKEIANRFFKGEVQKASKRPTPAGLAEFEKERTRRKAELLRGLGLDPMPPKTPLNARTTGTIQRPGYKIEKIVFESRPGFYVTAHLYLPDPMPAGKLPVVVHVNGHWAHKKNEDRIQLRAAFCALRGYAAFAIDSPGVSFEGNSLIERRAEGDHNDWLLAMATNTTGYYVWDTIRGLDYLETRPDMDMSRIGLTGASGGGLATLYAFAADDRYKAAVPVVYMSSMELAPDNGCLCNHVPATSQVGDRSDIMAIQAPKPVYIFGAENDGEFPPDAMRLTGKKMVETWSLFGKGADAQTRIYSGGHDYSQPMREAMMGFFDKYLKGTGDGSPVPQPTLEAINSEDRQLLALDPPAAKERTMRQLTLEYLANAPKDVPLEQAFAVNGGKPTIAPTKLKLTGKLPRMTVTFESEPGLVTPGIFLTGADLDKPVTIVVSDDGKASAILANSDRKDTRLYLDILGTGELKDFEQRYLVYLGRSVAFTGGIQIAAAAKSLRQNGHGGEIHIEARGPLASMAAMWAGLMEPGFAKITGTDALKSWEDAFRPGLSPYLLQPRAHLMGSLESLRARVKNANWGR